MTSRNCEEVFLYRVNLFLEIRIPAGSERIGLSAMLSFGTGGFRVEVGGGGPAFELHCNI